MSELGLCLLTFVNKWVSKLGTPTFTAVEPPRTCACCSTLYPLTKTLYTFYLNEHVVRETSVRFNVLEPPRTGVYSTLQTLYSPKRCDWRRLDWTLWILLSLWGCGSRRFDEVQWVNLHEPVHIVFSTPEVRKFGRVELPRSCQIEHEHLPCPVYSVTM